MPDREDACALLIEALRGEQRPVLSQRVLEVVREKLDRARADQFTKWFSANGARLMEQLNGRSR